MIEGACELPKHDVKETGGSGLATFFPEPPEMYTVAATIELERCCLIVLERLSGNTAFLKE